VRQQTGMRQGHRNGTDVARTKPTDHFPKRAGVFSHFVEPACFE
jgi:hypothetical protein